MTPTPWKSKIVGHGRVAIAELRPHPANWRTHPRAQREALSGAIAEVGYIRSVLVNRQTGNLLDGHLRVDLARSAGEPEVDAEYVDLTPEEERAALLSLDPIGAMAGADSERLEALLREVRTDDAGLRGMLRDLADEHGVSLEETPPPEAPEPEVDRAEELRVKWGTALGQTWLAGRHRLVLGDCTDPGVVARVLAGKRAALAMHDPPYGIGILETGVGDGQWHGGMLVRRNRFTRLEGDDAPFDPAHLLDSGETVVLWGANHYADKLPPSGAWLVWDKRVDLPSNDFSDAELAWVSRGGSVRVLRHTWNGLVRDSEHGERRVHPTQKPVAVWADVLARLTPDGALVTDWYLGSGTTILAAEQTGRRCAGCEIDPGYGAVILERLSQMGLEPRLVES